jgi:hypothetical protein
MVQSSLHPNGNKILTKYYEKRMLSEFARYIAKKEQSINICYCTNFTRLMIRSYGQQFMNKIVSELKK